MSATGNSQAERISRWASLIGNLESEIADLPQLAEDVEALKALLAKARGLDLQQDDLRSQVRALNDVLVQVLQDGDKLRRRMGATLHGKFGFTSERLVKYGFKPRRVPIRRRNPQAPEAPPASAAGQAAAKAVAPEDPR